MKYYKSPMNYLGNKYRLLPEILNLFPKNIDTFYDVFCGGLDVSLNVSANKVIANDKHGDLIWLLQEIQNYKGKLGDELFKLDKYYFPTNEHNGISLNTYRRGNVDLKLYKELLENKKVAYYKLREQYNTSKQKDFKILALLMLNSVGNIEFRSVDGYVTLTCGENRVSQKTSIILNEFTKRMGNVNLFNKDFRDSYNIKYNKNDFVYLDPPYLSTSQYKIKWKEEDERDLYIMLDWLNSLGVKFMLSNFADGTNHTNEYLSKWCGKYNIHTSNDEHKNLIGISKRGKRQEILVTNY